jgi:4-amino-4-deoxy-L-arabinose transferase-like glycosyltransferase
MVANDAARIVPHLNGREYASKPPGWFWTVAALAGGAGLELRRAALLPSVLASALATALVAALGRRLFGTVAGLAAALVFATSAEVLVLGTAARLDPLLALWITLSLFCWARRALPEATQGRPGAALLAASGLCAGLGLLVKGPVAVAVPGVVIVSHSLATGGWRAARVRTALLWLALALLPAAAWLGAAASVAGLDYATTIAFGHGVGHPLGFVDKQRPLWFYLKTLPAGFLPWTLFAPAALLLLARTNATRERSANRFVLCWIVAPFLLFSLFSAKRNVYLLPLYPGLALGVGRLLALEACAPTVPAVRRLLRTAELGMGAFAALLGAATLFGVACVASGRDALLGGLVPGWALLRVEIGIAPLAWGFACSILLLAAGGTVLRAAGAGRRVGASCAVALAVALFLTRIVLPIETVGNSPRPFYEAVRNRLGSHPVAAYGGADYAPNLLLERERVPILEDRGEAEAFLGRSEGLVYLVAERRGIARHGLPAGTTLVLERPRALASALILLARPAPEPASLAVRSGARRFRPRRRRRRPGPARGAGCDC